ncbi:lactate racemase domain-containing protein, partial [Desulfobacterales bacterium HSG17]|nr:lactate racemase domain-containing protein [Desulfobacterales bacterium HSG17]
GVSPDNISIYIAYGTHLPQNDDESCRAYGKLYKKYRFIHHDSTDKSVFITKGHTSRGTPIMLRRDIADAGFLITFGAVSHHYFAGYGGGRKLIFPGLGFCKSIYKNHGLFLDQEIQTLAPLCQPGIIQGNPLAEDLAEFESFCPADMAIHGILNSSGEVCDLLVGSGKEHFHNACAEHGKNCEINDNRKYDLVLASCGGYPKDINFIQAHKAVHNAAKFVKDGGQLIILAQCRDSIGSKTFLPWFNAGGFKPAFDRLVQNYQGNGGTALSMMSKTDRINISMITELPDTAAEAINVQKLSFEQAVKMVKNFKDSLAVIPSAALLVNIDGENNVK